QWALVRVGRTSIADYLALAQGLQGSRERAVASLLIDRLQYVGNYLVEEGDRERYRSWLASLLKPAAQELGFAAAPGDSDDRKTLRATVFQALGNAGDPQAIAAARRLAEQALHAPAAVDANLASAALRIAARNGDAALYDRFLAAMSAAPTPEWTFRFLSALTAFRDEALIRRSLDLALSPRLRAQDLPAFTSQLLANPAGQRLAWEFLKAHWPELQTRVVSFGGGGAVGALGSICEAGMGGDVERFFAAHRAPGAERTVRHSLEDIRNCVELKSRQQKPLHDWLQRSAAAAR
ncbi:MAG TPA: ERAP1-like C-terminal domain-containing protein, partial [Thermoanaerobaculia bacterium]|nr:ERAP1-like C-terminal domain-containing protein [Thermoanaerobaculia bacterium]